MEMQEGLKALERLLDPYDWFYEVCAEPRRYVVYVHRMEKEQDALIPDRMMGYQIVIHFAGSKLLSKEQFVKMETTSLLKRTEISEAGALSLDEVERNLLNDLDIPDASLTVLTKELDRLEKVCGSNILQDIFYEVHDGKNAVTNLSAKYSDVKEAVQSLYRIYGFDTIYEELDG